MANLVDLAETLQCGVTDNVGRMNFPSRHPLNQSFRRGMIGQVDFILAIEMNDPWGAAEWCSVRCRNARGLPHQPARLAHLDDHHQRRDRIKHGQASAEIIDLGHGAISISS